MKKPALPTYYQSSWLKRIAKWGMMLTRDADHDERYSLLDGTTIPAGTARILIRRGWVKGRKDGMFDDHQTFHVLKP
jgi:hypothetical protein